MPDSPPIPATTPSLALESNSNAIALPVTPKSHATGAVTSSLFTSPDLGRFKDPWQVDSSLDFLI